MIFRAYWKSKSAPKTAISFSGFVKATDENDAKRIMEENLDTNRYEVIRVVEAVEHMISPQAITINFRNTSEYKVF